MRVHDPHAGATTGGAADARRLAWTGPPIAWTVSPVAAMGLLIPLAGLVLLADPAHGQSVARAGPTAGADLRCEAALRNWASGGAPPGLVTFGVRLVPHDIEGRRAGHPGSHGSVGLGPAVAGADGPVLAGAMVGSAEAGYRYPGPREAGDRLLGGRVSIEMGGDQWATVADLLVDSHDVEVRALGVGWRASTVNVYAGALALRSGPTCRGSLVLGGAAGPAAGVELVTARAVHLPLLGEVLAGTQVGRIAEGGPGNRHPLFHTMRLELRLAEDLVLGLHRAVIFGGSASQTPLTPRTLALMLLGITDTAGKDSDFENQVAAVDLRWRTGILGRPALFTAEYGADDSGFAFLRVPGVRITGSVRWGPHRDGWTGFEVIRLAPSVDDYPAWYRHGALAWGWTDRGVPLGSPLAGEGTLVAATWGRASPGFSAEIVFGAMTRGPGNLLAGPGGDRVGVASASLSSARGPWELSVVTRAAFEARSVPWTLSSSLLRRF